MQNLQFSNYYLAPLKSTKSHYRSKMPIIVMKIQKWVNICSRTQIQILEMDRFFFRPFGKLQTRFGRVEFLLISIIITCIRNLQTMTAVTVGINITNAMVSFKKNICEWNKNFQTKTLFANSKSRICSGWILKTTFTETKMVKTSSHCTVDMSKMTQTFTYLAKIYVVPYLNTLIWIWRL